MGTAEATDYQRFLIETPGPETIVLDLFDVWAECTKLLQHISTPEARFGMLRVLDSELDKLLGYIGEEFTAEHGIDVYVESLWADSPSDPDAVENTPEGVENTKIFAQVMRLLGAGIIALYREYGIYVDGVAPYEFSQWVGIYSLQLDKWFETDAFVQQV